MFCHRSSPALCQRTSSLLSAKCHRINDAYKRHTCLHSRRRSRQAGSAPHRRSRQGASLSSFSLRLARPRTVVGVVARPRPVGVVGVVGVVRLARPVARLARPRPVAWVLAVRIEAENPCELSLSIWVGAVLLEHLVVLAVAVLVEAARRRPWRWRRWRRRDVAHR
jgi:hypothetical protein